MGSPCAFVARILCSVCQWLAPEEVGLSAGPKHLLTYCIIAFNGETLITFIYLPSPNLLQETIQELWTGPSALGIIYNPLESSGEELRPLGPLQPFLALKFEVNVEPREAGWEQWTQLLVSSLMGTGDQATTLSGNTLF
jgi:hypothetical protein